jgi:hypothetical protein
MLDANEVLTETGDFAAFTQRLDLLDVHRNHPAPSTYIGSTNKRIDYMFGCHHMFNYIKSRHFIIHVGNPKQWLSTFNFQLKSGSSRWSMYDSNWNGYQLLLYCMCSQQKGKRLQFNRHNAQRKHCVTN